MSAGVSARGRSVLSGDRLQQLRALTSWVRPATATAGMRLQFDDDTDDDERYEGWSLVQAAWQRHRHSSVWWTWHLVRRVSLALRPHSAAHSAASISVYRNLRPVFQFRTAFTAVANRPSFSNNALSLSAPRPVKSTVSTVFE